jgi:hypothetical protein
MLLERKPITQYLFHHHSELFTFVLNELAVAFHLIGAGSDLAAQVECCGTNHGQRCSQFVRNACDEVHLQFG